MKVQQGDSNEISKRSNSAISEWSKTTLIGKRIFVSWTVLDIFREFYRNELMLGILINDRYNYFPLERASLWLNLGRNSVVGALKVLIRSREFRC